MGPGSMGSPPRVVRTEGGGRALPAGSGRGRAGGRAGRQPVYSESTGYLSLRHPEAPCQNPSEDTRSRHGMFHVPGERATRVCA